MYVRMRGFPIYINPVSIVYDELQRKIRAIIRQNDVLANINKRNLNKANKSLFSAHISQ